MADTSKWESIGTIVGDASNGEFTFILRSFKSRIGDVVAVPMDLPNESYSGTQQVIAWGRIVSINRFNPFFPHEAAQELANESVSLIDTVLSNTRDQLEAGVLVLGYTSGKVEDGVELYPLTYPIPPAATVRYPPADAIKRLLAGSMKGQTPLKIGTLIARGDVPVDISAEKVAARHLAIFAMTGGGKTVAARRILRELIELGYPIVIFDPHGDYLGLWEKKELFDGSAVKLFYPQLVMSGQNQRVVETLIAKMTEGLTEPQQEVMSWLMTKIEPKPGTSVLAHIRVLLAVANNLGDKKEREGNDNAKFGAPTVRAVRRSLRLVEERLQRMEVSNQRLRAVLKGVEFEPLPDPEGRPEAIVRPKQVSILYLGGYDHLTQSTIVSIVMEALFAHRAELADRIAPFLAVVEEAHNFIPSSREGTDETPSLVTLRRAITEGRKFGVGLILITQRPSRVDETILAQCNSFLVMRLVNPKDQSYVRSVMENLPESDARMLPGFGPGQGIISGQAVRFPLLVRVNFDADLVSELTGDEDFIKRAKAWKPDSKANTRAQAAAAAAALSSRPARKSRK